MLRVIRFYATVFECDLSFFLDFLRLYPSRSLFLCLFVCLFFSPSLFSSFLSLPFSFSLTENKNTYQKTSPSPHTNHHSLVMYSFPIYKNTFYMVFPSHKYHGQGAVLDNDLCALRRAWWRGRFRAGVTGLWKVCW